MNSEDAKLLTNEQIRNMTDAEFLNTPFTFKGKPFPIPQRYVLSAQPSALQAPEGAPLPEDAIREDQIRAADVQQFPFEALRILGLEPNPPSEPNPSMPLRSTERE